MFADSAFITLADLPVFLKEKREEEVAPEGLSLDEQVRRIEVREIKRALMEAGGVKARAARALGLTERVLGYKMKAYGLDG